jgi:hypothetical protein
MTNFLHAEQTLKGTRNYKKMGNFRLFSANGKRKPETANIRLFAAKGKEKQMLAFHG